MRATIGCPKSGKEEDWALNLRVQGVVSVHSIAKGCQLTVASSSANRDKSRPPREQERQVTDDKPHQQAVDRSL